MFLVQVQSFGTDTTYEIRILHQCGKELKLKVGKFWGLIPIFVKVTGEKLVVGGSLSRPPPPFPLSLIG